MPSRIQGITVEIGGDTTGLSKALSGVNKEIRSTQSQLKDVERLLKMDPGNTELLRQKYELLNDSIESTEEKLDSLREAEKQVQAQFARGEATEAQYNGLQREIIATEQALNRLQGEAKDTQNRIDNIDEDPIEDVEKAADDAGDALKDAGKDASTFGDMLKAGAIVEGVSSIIDSMSQLSEETKEYQRIMGSLEVSSQKAGYSADETAQVYRTLYGVLGDDQTAATTTANLQALGLSQEDLVTLTNAAIGAWATYGDSIPIDSLAESVNETIQAGQVTGAFADVLNWAGTNEDEFNERLAAASDETERQNIVMQELANQGLVQAGEAWQKNNESLVESNQAAADFQDTMAEMSERIQPILTAVQTGITGILSAILAATSGIDFNAMAEAISAGFGWIIENVIPAISTLVGWLLQLDPQIQQFALVLAGVAAAAGPVTTVIQGIVTALSALMSPVTLVVAAVGLLIGAFATLWTSSEEFRTNITAIWQQLVDTFTGFTQGIVDRLNELGFNFENIGQVIQAAWQALCDFLAPVFEGAFQAVATIFDTITSAILGVLDFFIGVFTGDWEQALNGIKEFWSAIWDGICGIFETIVDTLMGIGDVILNWFGTSWESALNGAKNFFTNTFNGIVSFFQGIPGKMTSIGSDIVSGIWNGISGAAGWLRDQIYGFCDNIVNSIKKFFGIGSPSKLMAKEVGKWIPPGITVGIDDAMPQAVRNIDAEMGAIAAVNPFANTQTTTTTTNNNSKAYTFGPGSIVINAQGMDVNTLYQQLTVRMQQEVRRKEVAYGHA